MFSVTTFREMQVKTPVGHCYTPVTMVKKVKIPSASADA